MPLRGRLDEADDVAVYVLHRGDQLAPTDVLDLLLRFRASVEERLHAAVDVVNLPVADRTRHPLAVAMGIQTDILAFDVEADVVRLIHAVPFDEIAPIVERSPAAARQLASRARRRVRGAAPGPDADLTRKREVVNAFLTASRGGDFGALLAVLDPDVVLRADHAAVQAGASKEVRGASAVADTFSGRARAAQPALVNGAPGAVWAPGGRPRVVIGFTVTRGKIVAIDLLADPTCLAQLDLEILSD